MIERADLPMEYSDDYWERRYSIRVEMIPSFLQQHSDMILRYAFWIQGDPEGLGPGLG